MLAGCLMRSLQKKQLNADDSHAVLILGMHRSGTSAFTGALERAGLVLGDVVEYAPDNLKGSRESQLVMALHEDILRHSLCSWHEPSAKLQFTPLHQVLKKYIIANHADIPVWGFKDPRTLLTLDYWLKDLPQVSLVGIFRHPFYVAESLRRRNSFSYEKGLNLWVFYNRLLLWHVNSKPDFKLIEFCQDAEKYELSVYKIAGQLGFGTSKISGFFEEGLRQSSLPNLTAEPSAKAALVLYENLQKRVI